MSVKTLVKEKGNQEEAIRFFKKSENSTTQAKFAEYFFLKDLILQCAIIGEQVSISRSDFDAFGYDILLGFKKKFFPVQMKAYNGKAKHWDVHKSLLEADNFKIILVHIVADKGVILPKYSLFNKENTKQALLSPTKNKHVPKCKIRKSYFEIITIEQFITQIFS